MISFIILGLLGLSVLVTGAIKGNSMDKKVMNRYKIKLK